MDKQTATTLAGSQSELARILGITRAAVFHWKTIPKLRIYQLKELRPEWFKWHKKQLLDAYKTAHLHPTN